VLGHEGAAFSAVIQPNGQIITGGWGCSAATCTQNLDFTFARYNADGSLDLSFGTSGKATVAVSTGRDEARGVALQADGKIVAAGVNLSSANSDPIAVVRLNTSMVHPTHHSGPMELFESAHCSRGRVRSYPPSEWKDRYWRTGL